MVEQKLFVHIIEEGEKDFKLARLSEDKAIWYQLPIEYQDLKLYKILSNKVKNAITAIN